MAKNKNRNKTIRPAQPKKVASSLADLGTIIDAQKLAQKVDKLATTKQPVVVIPEVTIPEVVVPGVVEVVAPISNVAIVTPTPTLTVEKTVPSDKTIPFKVPPKAHKNVIRTGVISGIQRSEPHNDINMLKIGTIIDGVPNIYTAQRKNFDTSVPFKVNDQVEFVLQEYFSKGQQRFNADKVKLVTTGVPIMDDIIAKMQNSPTIIAYSENQLRVLVTEYAKSARTIEDAIKAIETSTKLKFVGKTDIKFPMFAFEKK